MHLDLIAHRTGFRAIAMAAALAMLVIGARPTAGRTVSPATDSVAATVGSRLALPQGGNVIQVRDVSSAPIVEIVAWSASNPGFGVRTWVRRSGGSPDRYHRLWGNIDFGPNGRDVATAKGLNRPLQVSSATDTQNCMAGTCSPASTFGARLPDAPLRAAKEDVAVAFVTNGGNEFTISLRRGLLDAYLATVDSVITALKK